MDHRARDRSARSLGKSESEAEARGKNHSVHLSADFLKNETHDEMRLWQLTLRYDYLDYNKPSSRVLTSVQEQTSARNIAGYEYHG